MKATELMIGDFIRLKSGKIVVVHALDYDGDVSNKHVVDFFFCEGECSGEARYNYNLDVFEPIPLTPEILEKNGFSGEGYCMGVTGFMKEAIPGEKDGYEVWIWKDMCLQIKHGFTHYKKYIKYVHELQHALRICGIDKEITI